MKRLRTWLTLFFTAIAAVLLITACNSGGTTSGASPSKSLIMATSADYPPFEFISTEGGSQEIVGFDVDIAKYITEKTGYALQIQNLDFNGLLPALQSKRADFVMAGMTPTEERKKNVDFSDIYYEAKNTIVAKKGSGLTTGASLAGKKVGVQLSSIQEGVAKKIPNVTPVALNRISELVQELKTGRIDAVIMEDTVAKGFTTSNPDLEFNVIPNEGEAGSAIAFPKGSPLATEFNPVLKEMISSGKIQELVTKWFGDESPAVTQTPAK
ncbi:MAG: transporter substrate-binding domain-containing protein [Oscillatoriophycideae cyanobacterium NC_groundwater_1537_Pr4_S-0.65um_50_18]|nr:transporter substrate-binding domain-containing protein [Oscillatoriophycideae cyanobacterium NC_groundwater_1537_Pr4_S-0.65um_50_18]